MSTESQRKSNLRMAWILAAIAVVFGLGFVLRVAVLGG
jgi:predicted nucleic acid-binding Zn ribbon protein